MRAVALFTLALIAPPALAEEAAPLTPQARLAQIDARVQHTGDYHAKIYIEGHSRERGRLVYEAEVYRRDADDRLIFLFTAPKAEAGKGYLKIGDNLFFYDPSVGRWERRTAREALGGTQARLSDLRWRPLSRDYTHEVIGEDKLGRFDVLHLKLTAKPKVEVPYPIAELWIDLAGGNALKVQERGLSGRLMRTVYYPRWLQSQSPSKGAVVYSPQEIRVFDEVEVGDRTTLFAREVDLSPLPEHLFTKAWLESQSR
ncbi:outer membrane lipoprotein-sorting protein [Myxococcota bacterium]|nr:outer membrane lipoprotein-sorting protein [Myxococcota bacterium]